MPIPTPEPGPSPTRNTTRTATGDLAMSFSRTSARPHPAPHGPAPHGPATQIKAILPRTLLLVEDSRLAAEAVRLICRRSGIRLRRADSLASAQLHLKVYRPDIALIDLGLPDGSGLALIAALAASRSGPRRLVAISGDAELRDAAMNAGADAFLTKPISLATHLSALTGDTCATVDDGTLAGTDRAADHGVELGAVDDPEAVDADTCLPARSGGSRNAGADPLALRDDLRMVQDLLNGAVAPARLRYAGQFLASVGHSLQDPALSQAARDAAERGDRSALIDLARQRVPAGSIL